MTLFKYEKFGKLTQVDEQGPYWHITNEEGKQASINFQVYQRSEQFKKKLDELVGYDVVIRTTRNADGSANTFNEGWFSDIFLDDGLSDNWPKSGDLNDVETLVDARLAIRRLNKRHEEERERLGEERQEYDAMLRFEQELTKLSYNQFQQRLKTEHDFTNAYRKFVLWKNARGRTPEEFEMYPEDKKAWDKQPPLREQGFEWRAIGNILSYDENYIGDETEVAKRGTIKIVTEDFDRLYFAFPQHVYYRELMKSKLALLHKHECWALINDNNWPEEIRFIDITIWDANDEELKPYESLIEIELASQLTEKVNSRAERFLNLQREHGELLFERESLKPTDDELVFWHNQHIRPYRKNHSQYIDQNIDDPQFKRMYDAYLERKKIADENGEDLFDLTHPIANLEDYKWIELPASHQAELNREENSLEIYFKEGDIRRWMFEGGVDQLQQRGLRQVSVNTMEMSKKLDLLRGYSIYVFVNSLGQFAEATLNDGTLESDTLSSPAFHEDVESRFSLRSKLDKWAKRKMIEADEWQVRAMEAEDRIHQMPMEDQKLLEYYTEQIEKRWDWIESTKPFPVRVIGMAAKADNARPNVTVWPTHADATLAVRCGINMSSRSKLRIDVIDRYYKNGKPHRNMVIAEIDGQEVTLGLGISTDESTKGDWIITTCYQTDARIERALRKLGFTGEQRDMRNKKIKYFLDLHKKAVEMVKAEQK